MALTPMMNQYFEVKNQFKDCIVFFRLGDFYEMFFKDAEIVSKELELVLTGRDCGLKERAPMCGVPYHAANMYIGKLIQKGYKIAICEQLEDPKLVKGLVKRGISKIITPGTYTDSSFLNEYENNYVMSLFLDNKRQVLSMCFTDISTGEFNCTFHKINLNIILDEISKFLPKEIIIQEDLNEEIFEAINEKFNVSFTRYKNEYFCNNSLESLKSQFNDFDFNNVDESMIFCANGLLNYIKETQKINLSNINEISIYNIVDYLSIDLNTRRNLELTETLKNKSKKGSLLWVLDKTNTAMGARELRRWVEQPLINKEEIDKRLNSVFELTQNLSLVEDLKSALKDIYDIERLSGKISTKSINAKEIISLKNSLGNIPKVKDVLSNFESDDLAFMYKNLDELKDVYNIIDKSIKDEPSLSIKDGDIIKDGFNKEVDELRNAKNNGKEWIAKIEENEKSITGIKSLKIGFNKVFGYYIEIRKTNLDLVPKDRYIRKQTLANAERYITEELKNIEEKILGAETKLLEIEYNLFVEVREKIENEIARLKKSAKIVAQIDCLCSFCEIAIENNYCKPKINEDGIIDIKGGRHPVVEKVLKDGSFVENDILLDNNENEMLLITGPNMAGKSTYMRQIALIDIMAQMGSFVPARKANISICDKLFTRIGASDDLASGKSTFMVEMSEVSNILKNATNNSLVLLDEVGRGTSTYDGLSIAWAVIEYICNNKNLRCKTLFATHYHELTKLEGKIKGLKNYSVSVKEYGSDIIFLRKIIRGGADESYGIQVAKLAGLPEELLKRASDILKDLENNNSNNENLDNSISKLENRENFNLDKTNSKLENKENFNLDEIKDKKNIKVKEDSNLQLSFVDIEKQNIIDDIKSIDILNLTPMEGFNELYKLIEKVKSYK